jgi:protein-tyrosine phosphatase
VNEPEDATCDTPTSFVAGRFVAVCALDLVLDRNETRRNRITHVVSILDLDREQRQTIVRALGKDGTQRHLVVPLDDTREEAARFGNTFFIRLVRWIQQALHAADARVLLHCYGGISRSPTVAVAYLVATTNQCVREALYTVRRSRAEADPLPAFLRQLDMWNMRIVRDDLRFVANLERRRGSRRVMRLIVAYATTPYACTFCGSCAPM